jgi:hypothetical protein
MIYDNTTTVSRLASQLSFVVIIVHHLADGGGALRSLIGSIERAGLGAASLRPLDLRLELPERVGRIDIDQRRAPGHRHFGDGFRVARDQVAGADVAA